MVVAVFEYSAQNDQELSFDEGDEIELLQRTNADWWRGRIAVAQGAAKGAAREGYFPASYVQLCRASLSDESYEEDSEEEDSDEDEGSDSE